ncbi:MAG: signal recognition particle protein [Actinomycetota bacterium]|nr:signal recognition particle protein [Actinomycetota bacterium]MDK1292760.1 signal recognition particle protein [Actinomycetota bacterium]
MFESLSARLNGVFVKLRSKGRLSEDDINVALREVRIALLEADVNLTVVKSFIARVKDRAVGTEVTKSLTPGQQVIKIVHEELIVTLGDEAVPLKRPAAPPLVILMVGLQGSGKTTTAAKLAKHLKGKGKRPLLVAADLQRPAAIDQLETLGRQIGVPVYVDRRGKPARVVKDGLKAARVESANVVIVDTAGRLQIDTNLMKELAAIKKIADPDETLLVLDAMTGQEAVNVARGFSEYTDITGLILTKIDGDARGGAAISAREVTGVPVKFVGTGETIGDLDVFHPDRMASRILGMGDVMSLIEKAEETYDQQDAERAVEKMRTSTFDLEDFLEQFQQLKKMGPLQQLVGMLPGAGAALQNVQVDDKQLARVEAIIRSMTPSERRNPKTINGSRKRRIATGSGTRPQDVNGALKQFSQAQKMMKAMVGGKNPFPGLSMPGMQHPYKKR